MIKITFIDGTTFKGESFDEIAKTVKKQDASLPESIEEYMQVVDRRYDIVNVDLDTSSAENFFRSLSDKGFIKIKEVK